MPWARTDSMSERLKFIAIYLEYEACFSDLCRDFGISRKTGYKWLQRFEVEGAVGLEVPAQASCQAVQRLAGRRMARGIEAQVAVGTVKVQADGGDHLLLSRLRVFCVHASHFATLEPIPVLVPREAAAGAACGGATYSDALAPNRRRRSRPGPCAAGCRAAARGRARRSTAGRPRRRPPHSRPVPPGG